MSEHPLRAAWPIAALLTGGCLERTLHITSDPPGAIVTLNDVELGRTPLAVGFVHYGTYDVRLRREEREPLATLARADMPLYELPPIDLLLTAAPVSVHTRVHWHFDLPPAPQLDAEGERALLARARALRARLPGDASGSKPPTSEAPTVPDGSNAGGPDSSPSARSPGP